MKRSVLSLLAAALFAVVTPVLAQEEATVDLTATVLTEDEPSLDLATTTTTQCPTCGPVAEIWVYNDRNLDGKYDPQEGEELWDGWSAFLYKVESDGHWVFLDKGITGGSDTVYYSGADTGKVYFRPLVKYTKYAVCVNFPRGWLFLTEPIDDGIPDLNHKSSSLVATASAWVGVLENPQPLAYDDAGPNERNWDETQWCYWVYLRDNCNNVQLRFGVLTYDTLGDIVSPSPQL